MEQDIHSLPWMSRRHQAAGTRQASGHGQQDRLPRQVARLPQARDRPRRRSGQRRACATVRIRPPARPRSASPSTRGEWDMTPPTVNAYYDPQMNDINFPRAFCSPRRSIPSPTPLRTMATPAAPSATNSPTASTTKAASSTRRATCATGGPTIDGKEFEKRASCISDQYSTIPSSTTSRSTAS